jgi:DNA-binding XRE family transcriptional regulator
MSKPEKKWGAALAGLKHLRGLLKMSQQRLAIEIGVDPKCISRYESEEIVPRMSCLKELCRVLKCQLWQLFFDPEQHQLAA